MARAEMLDMGGEDLPPTDSPEFDKAVFGIVANRFHAVLSGFIDYVVELEDGRPRFVNNIRYESPLGVTVRRQSEKIETKKYWKIIDVITAFGLSDEPGQFDRIEINRWEAGNHVNQRGSRQPAAFSRCNRPVPDLIFNYIEVAGSAGVQPSPDIRLAHGLGDNTGFENLALAMPDIVGDMATALDRLEGARRWGRWAMGESQKAEYLKQVNGADPRMPKPGFFERLGRMTFPSAML